jgi:hypothetical protein
MFEHITNMNRFSQQICFGGLRFERGIKPTDIDGFLEFDGVEFIFLEYKYKGKDLPWGQRLAFTRMFEAMTRGGVNVLGIIAEHETEATSHVPGDNCLVKETWISPRAWRSPKQPITVKNCIDSWRKYWRDKAKILDPIFPDELQDLPLFQPRKAA